MVHALVIGYGNPLRQDDGAGWRAAQMLEGRLSDDEARVIACHQLTPELAEPIAAADRVIFIDAEEGEEPGRVACAPVTPEAGEAGPFSHHVSPGALLACAGALYGHTPEAYLVTVVGSAFGVGQEMTPEVRAALPRLVAEAESRLRAARSVGEPGRAVPGAC